MAILGSTTLTGCNYIPDFIGSGYHMIFENASAPTSWTKNTSLSSNGVALRVVTGTASSGGTETFSATLTSRTIEGTMGPQSITSTGPSAEQAHPPYTFGGGNGGNSSITGAVAELPTHTHTYPTHGSTQITTVAPRNPSMPGVYLEDTSTPVGDSGQHAHPVTKPQHTHTLPNPSLSHSHSMTSQPHTHNISVAQDFSVTYIDVIVAEKD